MPIHREDADSGAARSSQRRRGRRLCEDAQSALEPLDVRIRIAALVPEVVGHVSFSRSSFIPRCRFTRTDAAVSPVRSAISAPVIPSTSRSISVSR